MDPRAVAKWLIYTSDGTEIALRKGRGHSWRHWDARKARWIDSRGFVSHLLACADKAHPALMQRARELFCEVAHDRSCADDRRIGFKEFSRTARKAGRLMSYRAMSQVVRACKVLSAFDEPPDGPVDALAKLRARVAA